MAVAVGVHRAIAGVLPQGSDPATIKWPNDILISGAKVSGILLESETLPDGRSAVVIGCGINVVHAPDEVMYPTTTLHAVGASISAEELFARLYQAMGEELDVWNAGRGVRAVRKAWLEKAEGVGKPITVKLPQETISGTFREIDQSGCLVLVEQDKSVRTIAAGDVFFQQG